jgi:hypothetical protein
MRALVLGLSGLLALASSPGAAQTKTDWPTFGFDLAHSGYNPNERVLSPATAARLQLAWEFDAAAFARSLSPPPTTTTGHFRAQPLVASNVSVGGVPMDLVLVGDNDGLFIALDANSVNPNGGVVWYRSLGTIRPGCTTSIPAGILGTAALDRNDNNGPGAVYVGNNAHVYGFDLASGATLPGWPAGGLLIPNLNPAQEGFLRAGLTLRSDWLYVANASKCDFAPFHGQIALVHTDPPRVHRQWFSMSGNSSVPSNSGGSIWSPGGVSIDVTTRQPYVFAGTGNGYPDGPKTEVLPYGEAVVQLQPNLSSVVAFHQPGFLSGDDDIAHTPVLFTAANCSHPLLAVGRKSGQLYIYERDGIGTIAPAVLQVASTSSHFIGSVAIGIRTRSCCLLLVPMTHHQHTLAG